MPTKIPTHQRVERQRGRKAVATRDRRLRRTNYLCEMCMAKGRYTPATVVNHKTPLAHGGSDEDDNTENLCAEHDREATARQFGQRVKQRISVEGWPIED